MGVLAVHNRTLLTRRSRRRQHASTDGAKLAKMDANGIVDGLDE